MLFILRTAFWITLICLLLPSSPEDNRRLIASAEQTMNDMKGFCQRNPQVCNDASATMTSLLAKFRSGAEMLQTWLDEQEKEEQGGSSAAISPKTAKNQQPLQPIAKWQDSLSSSDKQMPWNGPSGF